MSEQQAAQLDKTLKSAIAMLSDYPDDEVESQAVAIQLVKDLRSMVGRVRPREGVIFLDMVPEQNLVTADYPTNQQVSARAWDEVHKDLAAAYLEILGPEIMARREAQDEKHGGSDHDDTHVPHDWIRFIREYVDDAECNIRRIQPDEYESHLIDVAALCIAAIQSNRRKLNRPTPPEPDIPRRKRI